MCDLEETETLNGSDTLCSACGIAAVAPGELCEPCCRREAELLLKALENPRFASAFDETLLSLAIQELL